MSRWPPDRIICFTHIQKAGGTTMEALLRRNFGLRHMDVMPRIGWRYSVCDMAADLRLNPFVRSLAGHWLRPCVDFGKFASRLVWYTVLRRPVDRYISHYQHQFEKMGVRKTFDAWMEEREQSNWQVKQLAGEEDLDAAKQILTARFCCVGVLERFDESVLLLRHHLQLDRFEVGYKRRRNPSRRGDVRQRIRQEFDTYRDRIVEHNRLDLSLYDYVVQELYPRQVEAYGAERLRRDLEIEYADRSTSRGNVLREVANDVVRKAVYRPLAIGRRCVARLCGVPDVRR